jgi:hypothetical protein
LAPYLFPPQNGAESRVRKKILKMVFQLATLPFQNAFFRSLISAARFIEI